MKALFTSLLALTALFAQAQTSSIQNGNWAAAPSWDSGMLPPDNGDTVFISAGTTISVNVNTVFTMPLIIVVYGTLSLDQTLTLASTSQIVIQPGGVVTSGNNGWRLDIGAMSWSSFKNDPQTSGILTDILLGAKGPELTARIASAGNTILLEWSLPATPQTSEVIVLEKSYNGHDFTDFQTIETTQSSGTIQCKADSKHSLTYFRIRLQNGTHSPIVEVVNQQQQVQFYPNPLEDRLFVPQAIDEPLHITLHDILGNEVMAVDMTNDVLDVSHLDKGIYFLTIAQNGHIMEQSRLVKK